VIDGWIAVLLEATMAFRKRAKERTGDGTLEAVQRALCLGEGLAGLATGLESLIAHRQWGRIADASGAAFANFGIFAVAPLPHGLNVRSIPPLRLLRHALLFKRCYGEWVEVMELHVREPGRPKIELIGEDFPRSYKVSTSMNSIDRLLLTLKRKHPDAFAEVCALEIRARRAAIQVGLISEPQRRYGVCDVNAATRLPVEVQSNLLCDLAQALSIDAQCALLSRVVEQRLGPGLAQRWRESAHDRNPNFER